MAQELHCKKCGAVIWNENVVPDDDGLLCPLCALKLGIIDESIKKMNERV